MLFLQKIKKLKMATLLMFKIKYFMNPEIINVKPEKDYPLYLWFSNGEEGRLGMKPYLDKGIFRELRDIAMFNTVHPFIGAIQWANDADLCPDTVYLDSVKI